MSGLLSWLFPTPPRLVSWRRCNAGYRLAYSDGTQYEGDGGAWYAYPSGYFLWASEGQRHNRVAKQIRWGLIPDLEAKE